MTPPEHLIIGWSCANVVYSAQAVFKKKTLSYGKIALVMMLAAMIPDIDSFFGSYTSTNPYIGHRGMTHSLLGIAVLGMGLTIASGFISIIIRIVTGYWNWLVSFFKKKETGEGDGFIYWKYLLQPFFPVPFFLLFFYTLIAGVSHLLVDMIQPPSVWKGIPLLFPLKENGHFIRHGGWNFIGWFDLKIFWVMVGSVAASIPVIYLARFIKAIRLRYAAIPFFVIVMGFNIYVYAWAGGYVKKQRYRGEGAWWRYQNKIIRELPEPVRKITLKGRTIFISLWHQARRY